MTNGEPEGRRLAKGADADRTAKGEDRMVTVVHKAFRCVAEQSVHENDYTKRISCYRFPNEERV